jgi:multidrug resistance efflux pump
MKNIAYWTTLLVAVLSVAMLILSCGSATKSRPSEKSTAEAIRNESAQARFTKGAASAAAEDVVAVSPVTRSKLLHVLAPDGSFVVRGQILYILDGSDIWNKIQQTEALLKREMKSAAFYERMKFTSQTAAMRYTASSRRVQELNTTRNNLYAELSKTRVRAPYSGTLGSSRVKAGDEVYPGLLLNNIVKYDAMQRNNNQQLAMNEGSCDKKLNQFIFMASHQ